MEGVLRTLNLQGNIARYVQCFQIAGYSTFDDLLMTEPSLYELEVIGINIAGDREKIFYEVNPEAALLDLPTGGGLTGRKKSLDFSEFDFDAPSTQPTYRHVPSYRQSMGITAGTSDAEELELLRKQYELLASQNEASAGNQGVSEEELELQRMREEHAALLGQLNNFSGGGSKTQEELEYERTKAEYEALLAQASSMSAAPAMSDAESEYEQTKRELEMIRAQMAAGSGGGAGMDDESEAERELAQAKAEYQALLAQVNNEPSVDDEAAAIMAEMNRMKEMMAAVQANPNMHVDIAELEAEPLLSPRSGSPASHPRMLAMGQNPNDGMRKVQSNSELNSRNLPARPQNTQPRGGGQGQLPVRRVPADATRPNSQGAPASPRPLSNQEIATKAREMMAQGVDRAQIAAWVKQQQATQDAANAPPPAAATQARPMPQPGLGRAMPTPNPGAAAMVRSNPSNPTNGARPIPTPVGRAQVAPTGVSTSAPGAGANFGNRGLPNPNPNANANPNPNANRPMGSVSVSQGANANPAGGNRPVAVSTPNNPRSNIPGPRGLGSISEDTPAPNSPPAPAPGDFQPTNVVVSDNVPSRPDGVLRAQSKGAELLAAKTGLTLVPVKGTGISGVTLIQDQSAKAQIEALKALAAEGKNMSFGNDLIIEVADPVTVGKGTAQVTLFLVRLTTNMRQFSHLTFNKLEVRRRFNHFEELYNKLMAATNACLTLPKFPKKDFFARTSSNVVEQRLAYFQLMMSTIAKDPGLRCLSCVVDFFDDSKMEDIKFNDDGSAKLKGTSLGERMKMGMKETGGGLKAKVMGKKKDEY